MDRIVEDLAAVNVDLPPGWRDRIRTELLPLEVDDLDPSEPNDLVAAHFVFMNVELDDVTTIVFLQAMHDVLSSSARDTKPAFARVGKNQFMTRIVLSRRLASRYFHEGRRRVDDPATGPSGTWMLDRSLRLLLGIIDRDDRATPAARRMMHSQIATASAHLARALPRNDPPRVELLRTGFKHSQEAERHGDRSPDHDGYAIELALRRHELDPDNLLDDAGAAIGRTHDTDTAVLQGLNGDVRFARALDARADGDMVHMATHLRIAIDHYSRAIALPHDEHGPDVGYLLAKRGRSHATMYESAADTMGSRDTNQLERALADWLDPRSEPHRRDHEIARMLLARARLATARSDPEAAGVDIAHAAQLLADHDPPGPGGQLQRQALEVALERALDEVDPDAALEALAAAAALPPDFPVPAGAMTKTALWLLRHVPRPGWEQVVRPVLDRVEADAAHPSLSSAARGHVTAHAATLARVLARSADAEAADVLRAVDLSRAHLEATPNRSAAALDGASQAAAAYAALRRETTEAPSVDELGSWLDAFTWGLSALQTEQMIRTTVMARFDVGACAVRVAEAASMIRETTGDSAYLESAMTALTIAESLTADSEPGSRVDARIETARDSLARLRAPAKAPREAAATSPIAAATTRRRRATRPAGPPRPMQSKPAPDASTEVISEFAPAHLHQTVPASLAVATELERSPAYEAWRRLTQADQQTGQTARVLRQQAAEQFCELIDAHDHRLGGKIRGGQRGVTIIDDPTGLARHLVVLKRVDRVSAGRERDSISHLSNWRVNQQSLPGWNVPETLGIVDLEDGDTVLVMRRLPGHTLAHHTMEYLDGRAPHPSQLFQDAALALADFHTAMIDYAATSAEDVIRSFLLAATAITGADSGQSAAAEIGPILTSTAQLAKRDAHAGNWIWSTASGGLILLDVEGATSRPAILELATLLDDLPLHTLDNDGWSTRLGIAQQYIDRLPSTHRPDAEDLRVHLEAANLHTAVIGQARLHRRTWGASSRGIRYAQYQQRHYRDLTEYLARSATSDRVRRAAAAVLASSSR